MSASVFIRRIGLSACVLAGALWSASCGSALRGEPSSAPLRAAGEEVATGQRVFAEHCYQCHPGGAGGLAPALNDKPLPAWMMKMQVRAGLGAMPAFSKERISDEESQALTVYLKALRGSSAKAG